MRLEATIPDPRYAQLAELSEELNVSKSTLIDEALSLLMTGLMEARHGRRFAIIDAESQSVVTQVATPLLTQAAWVAHREKIELSRKEAQKVDELLAKPPKPTAALRKAVAQRRR
jgi:hypothetical protein